MPFTLFSRRYQDKVLIAVGLLALSGLMFVGYWLVVGDASYISNYFYLHLSFLPIHALVLGLILDELIVHREKQQRRHRLNMFLGVFFRQMGIDIMLNMLLLADNRDELEQKMLVDKSWKAPHFRRARQAVRSLPLRMRPDRGHLKILFNLLSQREQEIITLTRNPLMLEFEALYRCLLSLFHLIEETHYRGQVLSMSDNVILHLASDVGKTLAMLASLWLSYLEHLKEEHPVLFGFQVGLHNTIQPILLEDVNVK
ncbi:MAG: hypothetical protein C4525_06720 [Desulfarculus sp.]|nr:MAG: hypothetical protein C4525_06720 [Desulfarculus sp.]